MTIFSRCYSIFKMLHFLKNLQSFIYTDLNDIVAVTYLFPFANQCPCQAIRLNTDQSGTERMDPFFLSRTIFLVLFGSQPTVRELLVSSQDRPLLHSLLRIRLGTPSLKNMLLLVLHTEEPALQSVTRAICYSDTHFLQTQGPTYKPATPRGTLSHSDSFTSAKIINLSLLCFKRSFVIYLCCQLIYSVMETNHLKN